MSGLANYSLLCKPSLLPVFVNKVLLVHSHIHLFTYCLRLLSHCTDVAESLQHSTKTQFRGPQCLTYILVDLLQKMFPVLSLNVKLHKALLMPNK